MIKTHCVSIDSPDRARAYALRLLRYRGRSEKELTERLLSKGVPKHVILSTIQYLKKIGLINDIHLAESLKRHALSHKLLSHYAAKQFLLKRGIRSNLVDLLFYHSESADSHNATILLEKKFKALKNFSPEVQKRRIYHALLRKGYSYRTIKTVLSENFKGG